MCTQCEFTRGCIVTLVAFVRLFSTVSFQMGPQFTRIRRCKVTLVAFVCLLTTVCFQMCPQSTFIRGSIVALVAFVGLLPTMSQHMSFDNGCMLECIVTLEAFVDIRPGHRLVCEFSISLSISEWVSFTYTLPLYSLSLNETKRNALKERRPWKWKYSLSQPTFSAKKVGSEV